MTLTSCMVLFALATEAEDIAGYVEKVRLRSGGLLVRAKLDTGAKTSSLGVDHYERFRGNGGRWLRIYLSNWKGKTSAIEAPLARIVKIKRHFGGIQERPVVRLGICLGTVYKETEVNLVDRTGYNYQMLIGREFLESSFVVDPARYYTLKPECHIGHIERPEIRQ